MKKLLAIALLAVTCGSSISQCHADPIGPKPDELVTVDGFQLPITAPAQSFAVNTPITISTSIRNVTTDKSLMILLGRTFSEYTVEVKNETGEVMPLTRFGIQLSRMGAFSWGHYEVAPGEGVPNTLILNQIYDMTVPGEYTVKVSHHSGFPFDKSLKEARMVSSNVLHLKVVN